MKGQRDRKVSLHHWLSPLSEFYRPRVSSYEPSEIFNRKANVKTLSRRHPSKDTGQLRHYRDAERTKSNGRRPSEGPREEGKRETCSDSLEPRGQEPDERNRKGHCYQESGTGYYSLVVIRTFYCDIVQSPPFALACLPAAIKPGLRY